MRVLQDPDSERQDLLKPYLLTVFLVSSVAATLGIAGGTVGRSSTSIVSVSVVFAVLQLLLAVAITVLEGIQTRGVLGAAGICFLLTFIVFCSMGVYAVFLAGSNCALSPDVRMKPTESDPCKLFIGCAAMLLCSAILWGGAAALIFRGRSARFIVDDFALTTDIPAVQ